MHRLILPLVTIVIVSGITIQKANSWTQTEHRHLADSALRAVIDKTEAGFELLKGDIWKEYSFGEICSLSTVDDLSTARIHRRGKSILDQLSNLSRGEIEGTLSRLEAKPQSLPQFTAESNNVIANYLLYHLAALRLARTTGDSTSDLRQALLYEAIALGYLADAFSAGHLLVPRTLPIPFFTRPNLQKLHDHYRVEGVFVINSRGEVWRTFGDKLLAYYPASHDKLITACITSLNELMLVFLAGQSRSISPRLSDWADSYLQVPIESAVQNWTTIVDGIDYYQKFRMPSLLTLPFPINATFSVKTDIRDSIGIHRRRHYPQLKEDRLHDPNLAEREKKFLYSQTSMPDWMRLDRLKNSTASNLIDNDTEVASVRYSQNRRYPTVYRGLIARVSAIRIVDSKGSGWGAMYGFGRGLTDDILVLSNLTLHAGMALSYDEPNRIFYALSFGGGFKLASLAEMLGRGKPPSLFNSLRMEVGLVDGIGARFHSAGISFSSGIEFKPIQLRFFYIALKPRLMYRWTRMERTIGGIEFQLDLY